MSLPTRRAPTWCFCGVYMTGAEWETAVRYVPPLLAFVVGVVLACWLRRVATFQMVSFPRVEGWTDNSVMVTSNFRQTVEGLFAAFAGSGEARPFRRPYVFGAMCAAFGGGAAIGALATKMTRAYSLAIPVVLLVIVLLRCEPEASRGGN